MIFSDFPEEEHWSKLDIKISEEQFARLPFAMMSKETDGKDFLFEHLSRIQ